MTARWLFLALPAAIVLGAAFVPSIGTGAHLAPAEHDLWHALVVGSGFLLALLPARTSRVS